MRFKFKLPLLLAVLAVGVMGVSAASASAHLFLLTSKTMEEVEIKAATTNSQGFEISGAVSVCMKGKFKTVTNALLPAEALEVHPTYSECEVELGGSHNATVTTTGCNYLFHAAAPKEKGTVDVKCETGKEILVKVETVNCLIKVGGQTGLKSVEYENLSSGAVEVKANVENIAYTTNCEGIPASGSLGKYREGTLPTPVLGSGAATAVAEAFKSGVLAPVMVE
jgi:hypothetical protein